MANSGKDINFGADLLPTEDGVYNLGDSSHKWSNIYGNATSATSATNADTVDNVHLEWSGSQAASSTT